MVWTQRNSYYTAKTVKGRDGKIHDSKFEAGYGEELRLLKRAKQIKDYQTQVNFPLVVKGYKLGVYIADFVVHHLDGSQEIVETKGWATPVFRLKWKIVEALYSEDYKITCIMQGKGRLRKPTKIIEF